MKFKNFKIWLVALSMALLSACGSQDSGSNGANTALQTGSKSASITNTSLLDSLAVLYPNGQMSEQQKTLAAKELLQNPAALRKTAPASAAISGQSAPGTLAAQVATGNFGPVYRIQNTTLSGSYFFTIYDGERDSALALHPEWNLEGTAFHTSRVAAPGLSPVHRFQSKTNGSYLYTIYDAERADIVANYSNFFAYEGISWYASQTAEAGYTPLYRFRNKVNGTYLFSSYEAEKDAIIANYAAIFELEGIAYYVRQTDPLELSLLAGGFGGYGNLDGIASEARLNYSRGMTVDAAGNTFIVEGSGLIRKVTPAGEVTTFAGKNNSALSIDGTGTAASFSSPSGIVIDSQGNLFVTESGFSRTVRKITPAGVVTVFAGNRALTPASTAPSVDGTGTAATFRNLAAIAIDSADNLYVADSTNHTIRKITPTGVVTTLAGDVTGTYSSSGSVDGAALSARFVYPSSITVDSANNVYVGEYSKIRKITPAGMVSTLAGSSMGGLLQDGTGAAAVFSQITAMKADVSGNVFVIESSLTRAIRKVTPAGVVTTFAGSLSNTSLGLNPVDGTGADVRFGNPTALTIDAAGNLLVMDSSTLRKITPTAVATTLVGRAEQTGATDGMGAAARFRYTSGMVFDSAGNMFVTSYGVTGGGFIRKITLDGVVTTLAGGGSLSATNTTGDGTGTSAYFEYPGSLAIDAANNLYMGESGVLRKITPAGVVSTIAGARRTINSGVATSVDGTGTAARFTYTGGMAIDSAGNLYVSEGRAIRKITPAAVVTTFVTIPSTTYGPSLDNIAIDSTGTLYVTDNTKIHKVTASAEVSTFVGAAGSGYADGDVSVAKLGYMSGITFDASNNMYIADSGYSVVRKITVAGQVSTVVGTAGRIGVVEGLLSGAANLSGPADVGVYGGKLYISAENSILKVNGLP